MIIHTFGGQANIMGKDIGFLYNGPTLELKLTGITFDEAQRVLGMLEGTDKVPATATPKVLDLVGHANTLQGKVKEPEPEEKLATKPALTVDPDRIKAIAAGSPQKPPKPEKEAKPKKVKAKEPEETEGAVEEVEPEEVEAAPAESPKPAPSKGTNGATTNGASKAASNVPKELVDARKLRDVITFVISAEKIDFGEAGSEEREEGIERLKKRCSELKDVVPCLSRINDLDSRIERTVEVMDMGEEVS